MCLLCMVRQYVVPKEQRAHHCTLLAAKRPNVDLWVFVMELRILLPPQFFCENGAFCITTSLREVLSLNNPPPHSQLGSIYFSLNLHLKEKLDQIPFSCKTYIQYIFQHQLLQSVANLQYKICRPSVHHTYSSILRMYNLYIRLDRAIHVARKFKLHTNTESSPI